MCIRDRIVNESKAAAEKLREETKAAVEKQLKEAQEKADNCLLYTSRCV